jgi:hypothetical protein
MYKQSLPHRASELFDNAWKSSNWLLRYSLRHISRRVLPPRPQGEARLYSCSLDQHRLTSFRQRRRLVLDVVLQPEKRDSVLRTDSPSIMVAMMYEKNDVLKDLSSAARNCHANKSLSNTHIRRLDRSWLCSADEVDLTYCK